MPINYADYPKDWKQIRQAILDRAHDKCEICGVCNHAIGYRERGKFIETAEQDCDVAELCDGQKIIKIVLTVAHLDHDTHNNDHANLKALCQRCHLHYDHEHHKTNAAATRRKKKVANQQEMPL